MYVGSEPRIALFKLCAVFAYNVCMYVYAKSCCDTCVTLLTPDDGLCCVWFVLMDSNWFKLVCDCFKQLAHFLYILYISVYTAQSIHLFFKF